MTFNAGIEAAAQEAFSAITAVCITEDGNTTFADHVASKIRALTRPSSSSPVEQREAVAWLDMRGEPAADWTKRHVATNPDYVERNGCENFHPLYLRPPAGLADAIPSLPGSSRDEVLEKLHSFVVEHYANQDMNHMDFRVEAYVIAAALEQSKEK